MIDQQELKRLLLRSALRGPGAAEAFERLYRASAPLLLASALRIVRRRELAEEVLHDAFIRIWNAAGSFDPLATQPLAWMTAIARNRALDLIASADHARVRALDVGPDDSADDVLDRLYDWTADPDAGEGELPEQALDARRARHWLRACLDELGAAERQALVLAYHHGLSHGELAVHLRSPLGTVKSWVRRGLASLRECVEHCMAVPR
jgi:RNA polymerase sigma-70 factor (ECF subfamily)